MYIFIFVYEVMEFLKMDVESHGKVMKFHFQIYVGTLSKTTIFPF